MRAISKAQFKARIQGLVAVQQGKSQPVTASALLLAESMRVAQHNHPVTTKMAWAYRLASARLESWKDHTCTTRYQLVTKP